MKLNFLAICCASLGMLLAAVAPASAHHSFGVEYDANKPVTLKGVVTKLEWTNPHSFIYIDVKDADRKVVNWKFEGFPPSVLYRSGWRRDVTLKVGDEITIFGWRARDGGNWGHSRQVTFKDGSTFYFGPPPGIGDGSANAPAASPTPSN
jgi:Family of unknown function (DUF6152)